MIGRSDGFRKDPASDAPLLAEAQLAQAPNTPGDELSYAPMTAPYVHLCRWSQPVDATLYLKEKRWSVTMDQGFRRGFTATEKTELWDRWQRGESLKAIGRAFGKQSSSIYFQLSPYGGIRPASRRRSRLALTPAEREEISRGIAVRQSARSMAGLLGRAPSTVSREISRNGGYDGYRATLADDKAWARAHRPKRCKLATNPWLRQSVASKLRLNWAPEQIAGWLKRAHPEDGCYQVSHETIYRSLFVQARRVLKKELLCHLRTSYTLRDAGQGGQGHPVGRIRAHQAGKKAIERAV